MRAVWFGFLCILAWIDLRKRSIPVYWFVIVGVVGVAGVVWEIAGGPGASGTVGSSVFRILTELAMSMAVGLLLLLFSYLTRGALGAGDGCFFLVTGLYLPWGQNLGLLCYGLLISSLYGMGVLICGMWKQEAVRNKHIPFLPFVWAAAVFLMGVIP